MNKTVLLDLQPQVIMILVHDDGYDGMVMILIKHAVGR